MQAYTHGETETHRHTKHCSVLWGFYLGLVHATQGFGQGDIACFVGLLAITVAVVQELSVDECIVKWHKPCKMQKVKLLQCADKSDLIKYGTVSMT